MTVNIQFFNPAPYGGDVGIALKEIDCCGKEFWIEHHVSVQQVEQLSSRMLEGKLGTGTARSISGIGLLDDAHRKLFAISTVRSVEQLSASTTSPSKARAASTALANDAAICCSSLNALMPIVSFMPAPCHYAILIAACGNGCVDVLQVRRSTRR